MFGYRRASFGKATAMLSTIRNHPHDLKTLFRLQELLIAEIMLAEGRVRENKGLAKKKRGGKSAYFEKRAQSHQQSIYYWKAFGDAIAFLYNDRFALKHVYYNTHNLNVRQDGGFISGSEGFEQEFITLKTLLNRGCPCILCELTNTIRYGDICLLIDNDPKVIEVKSSKTKDRRQIRQKRKMRTLREFYETDISHGLRGVPTVHRLAVKKGPKSFEAEFNQCIDESYKEGYALKSPEPGVCYVAISRKVEVKDVFEQVNLVEPWLFYLNGAKTNRDWSPYYPFTLLIWSEHALYDFMMERLHLIVFLDVAVMKDLIRSKGWTPRLEEGSPYPLRAIKNGANEEWGGISQNLLARAAMEAVSLRWVVEEGIRGFEDHPEFAHIEGSQPGYPLTKETFDRVVTLIGPATT